MPQVWPMFCPFFYEEVVCGLYDVWELGSKSSWVVSLRAPPPGSLYQLSMTRILVLCSLYGLMCIVAISQFLRPGRCRGGSLCDT